MGNSDRHIDLGESTVSRPSGYWTPSVHAYLNHPPCVGSMATDFCADYRKPVCHNDLYRGNVVFRDGQAVGLIDFDFAHPAAPLWDLAIAAWHWVPLSDGWRSDVPASRWPERLRILVEAYGLEPAGRPYASQKRPKRRDC